MPHDHRSTELNYHGFTKWIAVLAACTTLMGGYGLACLNPGCTSASVAGNQDNVAIQIKTDNQTANYQIRAEFDGLVVLETDDRQRKTVPMSVNADFRFAQTQADARQAVRSYQHATAHIDLDGQKIQNQLAENRRQVTVRLLSEEHRRPIQYFPAGGIIKQEELDLLTIPGDPLAFAGLLQTTGATIGEPWTASADAVRAFFALETVINNQISLMIKEQSSGQTKVYIMGQATGEVDGAYTEVRVAGVAVIDTAEQRLLAMRLNIDENRDPSQLTPGFQGKARLEVRRNQAELPPVTQQASHAQAPKSARLLWNTDSEFELIYDPRWKIIISDPEAVVLRFGERGTVLAQCNVLQLPKRSPDRPAQLEEFRREVEKLIEDSKARITQHDQFQLPDGCRVLRIVVFGIQDELQIAWLYYTINHPDGRRVALIFTIEQSVLGMFDLADQRLVRGVRFVDQPVHAGQGLPTRQVSDLKSGNGDR